MRFDFPYMYHYLLTHFHGDHDAVANVMSQFGELKVEDDRDRAGNKVHRLKFPEFNVVDLLTCYMPRDDGGLNLGQKLSSYTLNNVSNEELGLTKFEYKSEGLTLDQFYEKDPLNFLIYNLWDVVLVYKLDKKMELISLYNMQRRKLTTALGASLRGSSALFDTYLYGNLKEHDSYLRWGINSENNFSISEKDIRGFPKSSTKTNIDWTITSVDSKTCSKMLGRYPGA